MKNFRIFISATLAGIIFSIGSLAYLRCAGTSPFYAALVLAGALLAVTAFKFELFSDRAGYIFYSEKDYDKKLAKSLITVIGNIFGTALTAAALLGSTLSTIAEQSASLRFSESHLSAFAGAILCGILMFVATHGFKRLGGGVPGCFILIFASLGLLLLGAKHALIDIFYLVISLKFNINALMHILIVILGNFAGAIVFAELYSMQKDDEEHHYHKKHRSKSESK
ncbi:MAG: formate/nitrite transporter family protein [Clostridia bacterium]|nr:formate/nitrite transporter family protein [Clostridia bacterium]MBQ6614237.1 formate/nitrite transporter family protein [Clostridia bacterium]